MEINITQYLKNLEVWTNPIYHTVTLHTVWDIVTQLLFNTTKNSLLHNTTLVA